MKSRWGVIDLLGFSLRSRRIKGRGWGGRRELGEKDRGVVGVGGGEGTPVLRFYRAVSSMTNQIKARAFLHD